MTESQFAALAKLSGVGQTASREAARLVLVLGRKQIDAAAETGLSVAGVNNAVTRCRRNLRLAIAAAGCKTDSNPTSENRLENFDQTHAKNGICSAPGAPCSE